MAIEDGATLAIVLRLAGKSPPHVRLALRVFQDLRKARVASITEMGITQRNAWHAFYRTRDPALLELQTLRFYSFDAELYALRNFEAIALKHEPKFRMSDTAFDDVMRATGVEEKSSVPRDGRLFRKAGKPRQ
ncbi:hypothetical protein P7C70_g534, partial [Phenoliferia sp. Uapishka_3]